MRRFFARLANLFRSRRAENEMAREIASHLALLQEDFERRGLSPRDAALAARRVYGGVDLARELHREARSFAWIEQCWKDLRYAWRNLSRTPGFTILAVLALALGLGANASIFAVYNAIALKPLPVSDPGRLMRVKRRFAHNTQGEIQYNFAYTEYQYLRDRNNVFSAVVAATDAIPSLASVAGAVSGEHVIGYAVSANYFDGLGLRARLGRTFLPDEDRVAGANPVIVLSDWFWQRRFAADAKVLGQSVQVNGAAYTVIGVAPAGFAGTDVMPMDCAFWAPLSMLGQLEPSFGEGWREQWRDATRDGFQLLARLKPGIAIPQAQAQATLLMGQYLAGRREPERTAAIALRRATTFGDTEDLRFQAGAAGVWITVSLVLLVACANVANMLLARGVSRQREIAVRLALGAGRARVIRQLLAESVLVALLGGTAGILLSVWAGRLLWVSLTGVLNSLRINLIAIDVNPDSRVLAYGLALSLATGILVGLAPSLRFTRVDLHSAIKADAGARLGRSRLRDLLMGSQMAVSVLLLMVSATLTTIFWDSRSGDLGYDTRNTYLLAINNDNHGAATLRTLRDRLQTLPAIAGAAIGDAPLMGNTFDAPMRAENLTWQAKASYASDAYFETMGIRLLRGRGFTRPEADHTVPVAVISQATAKHFWPNADPLGQRISLDLALQNKFTDFEVVGVTQDVRFDSLTDLDTSHVYLPLGASQEHLQGGLAIRIRGDRAQALAAVQSAVRTEDPSLLPGLNLISFADGPVTMQRTFLRVSAGFAAVLTLLALTLAAIGIYGVMAFLVGRQTREIGIRMALGATPRAILRSVAVQGLRPVLIGMALGFAAAAALDWVTSSNQPLSDWMGLDPAAYGLLAFVLAIAALASFVPARRALRVDPMEALRHE